MPPLEARGRAAFDSRLDPASAAPVALALSGGGDSLALLHLAADWCAARGRPLLALTVDHRLHPQSPAWTAFAAEAARRAGAAWRGLAWEGDKPASGLAAAARGARHRLLASAARRAGARVLLTGHTRDDVAEGALMRRLDAPTLGRLSEWSPSPAWPEGRDLFLLRPLLGVGRAELRDWLRARGEIWIDDPANADTLHARVRARARLAEGERPPAESAPAEPAFAFTVTSDGRVRFDRRALDEPAAGRGLSAALLCASGTDRPPRGARLARLSEALAGGGAVSATLAGARIEASGEAVEIGRDAGERFRGGLQPLAAQPGEPVVWDGRFEIVVDEAGWGVEPLGGHIGRLAAAERRALADVPAWARGALPALMHASGAVRLPHPFGAGGGQARSLAGPRLAAACGLVAREADIGESRHGAADFATLC